MKKQITRIRKQNPKYLTLIKQAYYYFGLGMKTKEVATIMKKSVARVNNWARKYREEHGIKSNREDKIRNFNVSDESLEGLCRKWAYYKTKNYIEQHPSARIYFSYIWLAKTIWLMEEYYKKGGHNEKMF